MKFLIHLIAESEVGQQVQEIACLEREREEHRLEDVGLTLREAKKLLGAIQQRMVEQQVEEYLETQRSCPHCGRARGLKGSHTVMFQTLFGNLELCSPRWNHCGCRANPAKTFSPLLGLLDDHVSPERLYLETKWASLISFELAAHLLKDTLPVAETVNAAGVRNHLHRVAERAEAALGDERVSFIEGCPREWAALPHPQPPLKGQGMQMNQHVMFFSDGGTDIREVQLYLNPEAEHYLDWFHITMRLTVMGQYAKGLDTTQEKREEILK